MNKTIKQNGILRLEPDPIQLTAKEARSQADSDLEKVNKPIKENEIGSILGRILNRLDALEGK